MRVKKYFRCVCVVLGAGVLSVQAGNTYFVAPEGDDANDGASRGAAFATVQRGVDALAPGDTLTIAPGEYSGPVVREGLGWPEGAPVEGGYDGPTTTIRAEISGTAILRGDVAAPGFTAVEGYRFVYEADFDGEIEIQAVNELDTLSVLHRNFSKHAVEFNPGTFFQDREANKLYLSSASMRDVGEHLYTVSVVDGHGLLLVRPYRVVVEGLAATGFNSAVAADEEGVPSYESRFGIFLSNPVECVVRKCTAWLNGRGIGMRTHHSDDLDDNEGGDNLIEHCTAWANFSVGRGAAIGFHNPNRDRLEHCTAFLNGGMGLMLYGRGERGNLRNSLAWGNATDIQIKGYPARNYFAEHSVGAGPWGGDTRRRNAVHNLIGFIGEQGALFRDNITLSDYPDLDPEVEFADPANHDYRLQATSRFRGAGMDGADAGPFPYEANIYYVAPDGNDDADGLSVANAWQTLEHALSQLQAGDTLYLEGGTYQAPESALTLNEVGGVTSIRGRGTAPVIIEGAWRLEGGRGIELSRLNFAGETIVADAAEVEIINSRFLGRPRGLTARSVEGLRVEHCLFDGFSEAGIDLQGGAGAFLQGNLFVNREGPAVAADSTDAILFSDYNAFASDTLMMSVNGETLDRTALAGSFEAHATVIAPEFADQAGVPVLKHRLPFADASLHGNVAGPFNAAVEFAAPETLRIAGPFLHSTSATTANLEWWISNRTDLKVEWSTDPGFDGAETKTVDLIGAVGRGDGGGASTAGAAVSRQTTALPGSFSLTGLDPDTDYYVRLSFETPIAVDSQAVEHLHDVEAHSVTVSLRTAATDPDPVVYYVSTAGSDRNSGLSLEDPFGTVNHAAEVARPGDTIQIAGGTYVEAVHLRTTGDAGRPITFTPVPGEKVVFSGRQRTLTYFFYVTGKSHINIDGFYFIDFAMGGGLRPWEVNRNAAIMLYFADDVKITRCYMDRRGTGPYAPALLQAHFSSDVWVKNCVVYGAMGGGLGAASSPNLRVENNVFFRNFTVHVGEIINQPDQPLYLKNNIFTDVLPGKVRAAMVVFGRPESFVEANNLFYARIPEEERNVYKFYNKEAYERAADSHGVIYDPDEEYILEDYERFTLPRYQERFGRESTSFFGDPVFAGTVGMERVDEDGNTIYLVEQMRRRIAGGHLEHHFDILFATDPEILERGIGLQPEAFEDFHFHQD